MLPREWYAVYQSRSTWVLFCLSPSSVQRCAFRAVFYGSLLSSAALCSRPVSITLPAVSQAGCQTSSHQRGQEEWGNFGGDATTRKGGYYDSDGSDSTRAFEMVSTKRDGVKEKRWVSHGPFIWRWGILKTSLSLCSLGCVLKFRF